MDAIGYHVLPAGLTNQKLALLGLFLTARETGQPIVLPEMWLMDVARGKAGTAPIGEILDTEALRGVARSYGITVLDSGPRVSMHESWPYFGKGWQATIHHPVADVATATEGFIADFMRALVPVGRSSFLVRHLLPAVYDRQGPVIAAHFRIEADWHHHSAKDLGPRLAGTEDYCIPYEQILDKIKATLPGTRTIYVVCDEPTLLVPKQLMQEHAANQYGFELIWKSDILTGFELRAFNPLDLSIIDFEIVSAAECFVGMSRSTFSNMVTFDRFCRTGRHVDNHYVYNLLGGALGRRTDDGRSPSPIVATQTPLPPPIAPADGTAA